MPLGIGPPPAAVEMTYCCASERLRVKTRDKTTHFMVFISCLLFLGEYSTAFGLCESRRYKVAGETRLASNCRAKPLQQAGFSRVFQGFDGGSACAGGIPVRHDVDRDVGDFLPLERDAGADFADEPILELLARFDSAAAHDQGVRVEGVDHDVEEESKGVGLDAEDFAAHGVAAFGHAAYEFGGAGEIAEGCKLVVRVTLQEERQKVFADGGEGAEGFEVAHAPAAADGLDAVDAGDALIGDE